jgi:hypothetical protein
MYMNKDGCEPKLNGTERYLFCQVPRIRGFPHGDLRAEPSILGEEIHGLLRHLPFPVSADVLFASASTEIGIEQSSSVQVQHTIFKLAIQRKSFANISQ